MRVDESTNTGSESHRTIAAYINGELENNSITTSQASAMIGDIPTCRELIERMVEESKKISTRLTAVYQ